MAIAAVSAGFFLCCWFATASESLAQTRECGVTSENGEMFPPTEFAYDMQRATTQHTEGNVFFSPVSITLAFGMLYQGTRGPTASEIEQILFPSIQANQSIPAYTNLMGIINRENKPYTLDTANAIFTKEGGPGLDSAYQNIVETCFSSQIEMKPFQAQPEVSRVEINEWVMSKTNNLIEELLPDGIIDSSTEMVLVNAIYFKGQWLAKFDEANTREMEFKGLDSTSTVRMMHLFRKHFRYHEDNEEGFKVLELPYKGEELSMIIFLPETSKDFEKLQLNMSGTMMRSAMEKMTSRKMGRVAIPKFKVEYELPLKKVMIDMGVTSMFDARKADLSGINGQKEMFVSDAVHKAVIEVNELGSEAAAATGVGVGLTSEEILRHEFLADKPFIYFIVMKQSSTILFQGSFVKAPQEI